MEITGATLKNFNKYNSIENDCNWLITILTHYSLTLVLKDISLRLLNKDLGNLYKFIILTVYHR